MGNTNNPPLVRINRRLQDQVRALMSSERALVDSERRAQTELVQMQTLHAFALWSHAQQGFEIVALRALGHVNHLFAMAHGLLILAPASPEEIVASWSLEETERDAFVRHDLAPMPSLDDQWADRPPCVVDVDVFPTAIRQALSRDTDRVLVCPVRRPDRSLAALLIHRRRANPPTPHSNASDLIFANLIRQHLEITLERIGLQQSLERKSGQLETSAMRQKRRYAFANNILRSMPNVVLVTDLSDLITAANTQAATMLQVPKSRLQGQPVALWIAAAIPMAERVRAAGKSLRRDTTLRTEHGQRIPVQLTSTPMTDQDGHVVGVVHVAEDIRPRIEGERRLQELNERMRVLSHEAGKAEVATDILHNVGNVLNSVNVSASVVSAHLDDLPISGLQRLTHLLDEHRDGLGAFFSEDPRARQIPEYLSALSDRFTTVQRASLDEAVALHRHVDHIKTIVLTQQRHASVVDFEETVDPVSVAEAAIEMASLSMPEHPGNIALMADSQPAVRLNRHHALSILLNLIRNALRASLRTGGEVRVHVLGEDTQVVFQVRDRGKGIAPENLTRIFEHGFTTEKTGHGFGLHGSANLATQMSGTLTATSDGPGKGATFTLRIPRRQPAALGQG